MTNDIYEAAKARGLVRSLRHFSTAFLGRCPHYAADRGLDRCSTDTLLILHRRLEEAGQADLQAAIQARLLSGPAQSRAGGQP